MRVRGGKRHDERPTHSSRTRVAVEIRAVQIAIGIGELNPGQDYIPWSRAEGTGWHKHYQVTQWGNEYTLDNDGERAGYLAREIYIGLLESRFQPDKS